MKKVTFWLLVLAVAHVGIFNGTSQAKDEIKLSYSTVFPPTHVHARLGQAWADEIAKRTSGSSTSDDNL